MKKTITISSIVALALLTGVIMHKDDANAKQTDANKSSKKEVVAEIVTEVNDSQNLVHDSRNLDLNKTKSKKIVISDKNTSKAKSNSNSSVNFIKNYVAQIGTPNKKQKDKINHASRYGDDGFEFEIKRNFKEMFGDDLSKEKMRKLMETSYEIAYKGEIIINDYMYDKLSYVQYMEALNEAIRIANAKEREILSEEEFQKMYGDEENSGLIDIESMKKNQLLLAFPSINKKKYGIESAEDLDNYFSEEEKKKVIEIAEWKMKENFKTSAQLEENNNYTWASERKKEIEKTYKDKLKNLLTEEQLDILEGAQSSEAKKEEPKIDYEEDDDEDDNVILDDALDGLSDEQKEALERGEAVKIE